MVVASSDELSDDDDCLDFLSESGSDDVCVTGNVNGINNNADRASERASDNATRPHSGRSHSAAES